jgi:hypothetical protein
MKILSFHLVPRWKIVRELKRVQSQLHALLESSYEPYLRFLQRSRRHHLQFACPGHHQRSQKIAIFLIFQPNGIAQSTIATCEHLLSQGYSPLLVINHALNTTDQSRLEQVCWMMIRRQNFGYDFGGYQDAIWYLKSNHIPLDALVILNDSVWFPAQDHAPCLALMENSKSDFTGALQLEAYRSSLADHGTKPPFFGSFFLHLKSSAYLHPAFESYWRKYKASSIKYITIRRGEKAFSRTLIDAGISNNYIFSRRMFDAWIYHLPSEELLAVLGDLVSLEPTHTDTLKALGDISQIKDDQWKSKALQLAYAMTEKQNILSSAPIASLKHFQVAFIKKSADPHNLRALALIAERHASGAIKLREEVYQEILQVISRSGVDEALTKFI